MSRYCRELRVVARLLAGCCGLACALGSTAAAGDPIVPITPDSISEERSWLTQETYLGDSAHALGCPTAWGTTLGSRSVYVCVVSDKGVDLAHPDLIKNPNSNLGIVMSSGIPGPTQGGPTGTTAADAYGTAVAAVAAGNWSGVGGLGGNGQIIGVAPNASIYSLRTANLNPVSLAAALDQIVAETFAATTVAPPLIPAPFGATGGPAFTVASYPTLRRVALLPVPTSLPTAPNDVWTAPQLASLTNALAAGVVVVVAAGQDTTSSNLEVQDSIAQRSDVIVVGANRVPVATVVGDIHSRSGASVGLSTRGPAIVVGDLTGANGMNAAGAPAGNAATTFTDVTAAAAAQAAGVAALVLSANSRLTPADVRRILRESCEGSAAPIDPNGILGFGQLRADLSVAKAILPRAEVAVVGGATALECDFGDVEIGATLDKIIELRLKVPGSLSPVTYSVGSLPTHVTAITGAGFENPATLIAVSSAAKQLKLRVTAPSSVGAVATTLVINSDDDQIAGTPGNFSVAIKYNVVPKAIGDKCGSKDECPGAVNCVDGVCCDAACTGACVACTALKKGSGQDGTCSSIAAGGDPRAPGCSSGSTTCDADGKCDGAGTCRAQAPQTTSCGTGTTCEGNSIKGQACNGTGDCSTTGVPVPCAPAKCDAGACTTSCANDAGCDPDAGFCNLQGHCETRKDVSLDCGTDSQCKSGYCADGVCCQSACDGQCERCDDTGTCVADNSDSVCNPSSGGASGTAGASSTAGTSDDSTAGTGNDGTAGSSDNGTAGSSDNGTGGIGEATSTLAPEADSGCGCRTVGTRSTGSKTGYAWLLMLSLVGLRRRRNGGHARDTAMSSY